MIVVGFYYADESNWGPQNGGFLPYGVGGVIAGAATCFYAFVGFDSIATSGEEAKDPTVSIPIATILSMAVVTIGYVLVCTALTLIVPYYNINPTAALPEAFASIGVNWVKYLVSRYYLFVTNFTMVTNVGLLVLHTIFIAFGCQSCK